MNSVELRFTNFVSGRTKVSKVSYLGAVAIVGATGLTCLLLSKHGCLSFLLRGCLGGALGLLKGGLGGWRARLLLVLFHTLRIFTVFLLDSILGAGDQNRCVLGRRIRRYDGLLLHFGQVA